MVDGEVYHEMEVKNDSRIKFPDKPTKEGYVFDGWYLTEYYK
ncbi:MAG: InlB B-repeat-containing protein [Clostridia bacterium]|nr:InlB B-repeat-containing protein [Clostridia bacterium]